MQYRWLTRKAQRSQILRKLKNSEPVLNFFVSLSWFSVWSSDQLGFPNDWFTCNAITKSKFRYFRYYQVLQNPSHNTGWNPATSNAHLSKRALNHSAGLIKNQPTKLSTAGYLLNVSSKFSINYRILQPLSRHNLYSQQSCSKCHSRDYFLKSFIFRSDDDDLTTHSPIENWFTFHKFGRFSS